MAKKKKNKVVPFSELKKMSVPVVKPVLCYVL